MAGDIKFGNKNYLPLTNAESWVKSLGVYLDDSGCLVIPEGEYVRYYVEDLVDKQFKYFKLEIEALSSGLTPESSVDSDVIFELTFNYSNTTGVTPYSQEFAVGLATVNKISEVEYKDIKILPTMDRLVYNSEIIIRNYMNSDLRVKSVRLYISDDTSSSQVTELLNDSLANKAAIGFAFGTDESRTEFRELTVHTAGSIEPVVFAPVYDGEWPVGINISGLGTIPITWYVKDKS